MAKIPYYYRYILRLPIIFLIYTADHVSGMSICITITIVTVACVCPSVIDKMTIF